MPLELALGALPWLLAGDALPELPDEELRDEELFDEDAGDEDAGEPDDEADDAEPEDELDELDDLWCGLFLAKYCAVTQRARPWWTIWALPFRVLPVILSLLPDGTVVAVPELLPGVVRTSNRVVA